ncbi:MAG: hypothetical protein ABI837_00935, partial [Acidobacteriota bacterium]
AIGHEVCHTPAWDSLLNPFSGNQSPPEGASKRASPKELSPAYNRDFSGHEIGRLISASPGTVLWGSMLFIYGAGRGTAFGATTRSRTPPALRKAGFYLRGAERGYSLANGARM